MDRILELMAGTFSVIMGVLYIVAKDDLGRSASKWNNRIALVKCGPKCWSLFYVVVGVGLVLIGVAFLLGYVQFGK